jgi:hypothetical protein
MALGFEVGGKVVESALDPGREQAPARSLV